MLWSFLISILGECVLSFSLFLVSARAISLHDIPSLQKHLPLTPAHLFNVDLNIIQMRVKVSIAIFYVFKKGKVLIEIELISCSNQ